MKAGAGNRSRGDGGSRLAIVVPKQKTFQSKRSSVVLRLIVAFGLSIPALAAATLQANTANLVRNADLADVYGGVGSDPNAVIWWQTDGWVQAPTATSYRWRKELGAAPGEFEIDSALPNDARWEQRVRLEEGWYYVSVEARTVGVGRMETGANISILDDWIASKDLRGTVRWTRIGFYVNVTGSAAEVRLALRLGGYGRLNSGRAFFRNPSVVRVEAPPAGATDVAWFELDRKRSQPQLESGGRVAPFRVPRFVAYLLIGLIALLVWLRQRKPRQRPGTRSQSQNSQKSRQGSHARSESGTKPRPPPRGKSPHEILGVPPGASTAEIAAAYRSMAQRYHPDKVATMGPELRELAERKMSEINAAYEKIKASGR